MRTILTVSGLLLAWIVSPAISQDLALTLACNGQTIHVTGGRGGAITDTFKHDPVIYLFGDRAVVTWRPGSTKIGEVIRMPQKYLLLFPDPVLAKGARLVNKESSIDRVSGVFSDVTEVEEGRRAQRVEHTSTCEEVKVSGPTKF